MDRGVTQVAPAALSPDERPGPRRSSPTVIVLVGIILVVELAFFCYALFETWPTALDFAQGNPETGKTPVAAEISLFGSNIVMSEEQVSLIVVASAAGVGATIPALRSYGWYVGMRSLRSSWIPFMLLRTVTSIPLALVVYLGLRAGLVNVNASSGDLNPYGIAAIAAFTGFFGDSIVEYLRAWANKKFSVRPEFSASPNDLDELNIDLTDVAGDDTGEPRQ
jgi:hypothetical protein